jgi:hypothetical protein
MVEALCGGQEAANHAGVRRGIVNKERPRRSNLNLRLGRAIAQAVSRWLPTAAARVRARV